MTERNQGPEIMKNLVDRQNKIKKTATRRRDDEDTTKANQQGKKK